MEVYETDKRLENLYYLFNKNGLSFRMFHTFILMGFARKEVMLLRVYVRGYMLLKYFGIVWFNLDVYWTDK